MLSIDYPLRSFTRTEDGQKIYSDHEDNLIQNCIEDDAIEYYEFIAVNMYQEAIFHTRVMALQMELEHYLLGAYEKEYFRQELDNIRYWLSKKMQQIYY